MKVLGIIAEYNPFHNGHLYHLRESKKIIGADFVVAVMSGNFVQRGEPALINKWERAKVAIENGIDLVIELPVVYSCNSSDIFARGGIEILNGLGCVSYISFGSEEGSLEKLEIIADVLANESELFKDVLRLNLDRGLSFPSARAKAVNAASGNDFSKTIKGSNNILAIEYLKQLKLSQSRIIPVTFKRKGPEYREDKTYGDLASATHIRNLVQQKNEIANYVPESTLESIHRQYSLNTLADFSQVIFSRLLQMSNHDLNQIYSVAEGLENKIKNEIRNGNSLEELIENVISKRFTDTRLKRVLIHSLLGFDRERINHIIHNNINYCRVLGFSNNGAKLLRMIKKEKMNSLPIITNMNKEVKNLDELWGLINFDILAADLYNLVTKAKLYENSDYVRRPFV